MNRSTFHLSAGTLIAAAGALATGVGCNFGDAEYQNAPPTAAKVTIAVPGGSQKASSSSNGVGVRDDALLGVPAMLYEFTVTVSAGINLGTLELLGLVHAVASNPSTSQTANSRTWGPWAPGGLDPLAYKVVVTKLAPSHFSFEIDGAVHGNAPWLPLLDGEITKGGGDTGKGTMTLHFDNRRTLRADTCEQGSIAFAFDDTVAPQGSIDVMFHQFANANPQNPFCAHEQPHDATYHYQQALGGNTQGEGNFLFSVTADTNKPEDKRPALETVTIRSRWQAGGAGRSDATISDGDIPAELKANGFAQTTVTASQCWDSSFKTVFEVSSPAQINLVPSDGDPGKCVYATAVLP